MPTRLVVVMVSDVFGRVKVNDLVLTRCARRYTQVSERRRRSGRDAGTQTQGGETLRHSSTCRAAKLPSMALDTGIHAGMTTFTLVPKLLLGNPVSKALALRAGKLRLHGCRR